LSNLKFGDNLMSMNSTTHHAATTNLAGLTPGECYRLLSAHWAKWLIPTALCSGLALLAALTMPRHWEASQGFVVRREASASAGGEPGQFADLYQMRTFQETVLELARSKQVLSTTLMTVAGSSEAPSDSEVEDLRSRVSLLPPGGAEFGKTEVCYLQVKDSNRQRAIALVDELGRQLDDRLRRLSEEKSQSLSQEFQQRVQRAQEALDIKTERLVQFEAEVGADLGELRILNASYGGQSDLRQEAVTLHEECRAAQLKVTQLEHLLGALEGAQQKSDQLIAMPNSLLESQPILRRLKDGLVDAQLRVSRLEGSRSPDHPQVVAAHQSVQYVREDMHEELAVAVRGVKMELDLGQGRVATLQKQFQEVEQRLTRLSQLRAEYANRSSDVENSRLVLDQAQKQLGEVSATLVASNSASLVTPIDQAEAGTSPAGVGRASVVLAGTFGGFALGLGWLFLAIVPEATPQPVTLRETEPPVRAAEPERAAQPVYAAQPPVAAPPVAPVIPPATFAAEQVSQPLPPEPVRQTPVTAKKISSSLPPAVAARVAELLAARSSAATEVPV
jgi:uncharacterized protein involved in exopolysaccharide biosynthesis